MDIRTRSCENVSPGISGFMMGLLLGGIVTGVVALLYAPRSGQELRNRIKDEVTETQQMVQTWMNDLQGRAESIGRTFRTEMKGALQRSGNGQKEE